MSPKDTQATKKTLKETGKPPWNGWKKDKTAFEALWKDLEREREARAKEEKRLGVDPCAPVVKGLTVFDWGDDGPDHTF